MRFIRVYKLDDVTENNDGRSTNCCENWPLIAGILWNVVEKVSEEVSEHLRCASSLG